MTLKMLGAALMIAAGGALGFGGMTALHRRLRLLSALDASLALMEGEIALCRRPLPETFELLAQRGAEETRGLFACLALKCADMPAWEAWEECCALLELPEGAKGALLSLAPVLGAYEGERQSVEIAAVRRSLSASAAELRAEIASKGKSYPALGACLAGIAAMMLI